MGVDNYLSAPDKNDTVPPLELHRPYSRFLITIIDKSGNKTVTPKANIPAGDVPGILSTASIAMLERTRFLTTSKPIVDGDTPAAYTQAILIGNFKGKTPADILIENSGNMENLLKTRALLAEKMSQYSTNQKQMDAIDNAIALFETKKLVPASSCQNKIGFQTIYDVSYKYMSNTNNKGAPTAFVSKIKNYCV